MRFFFRSIELDIEIAKTYENFALVFSKLKLTDDQIKKGTLQTPEDKIIHLLP